MNVAVVNTGPGVTWPTAMASSSCASVSQCQSLDEVGAQEGEQHVAAAEQHRADLEEDAGTARPGRRRRRGGRRRRETRPRAAASGGRAP